MFGTARFCLYFIRCHVKIVIIHQKSCGNPMLSNKEILSGAERQEKIAQLLKRQQRITVYQICAIFSISEATARRDLEVLAKHGLARRVHGGATLLTEAPPEPPILSRSRDQAEEKQAIADVAAGLVQDGDTLFMGSGSTVLALARNLRGRQLTILTNSLAIINTLADIESIQLVSLGGSYRPTELSFIGHIAEQALAEVRADKVFLGVRALDLHHGLTNDYLPETLTDRAVLGIGREIIILADHTKIGRVSSAFVAPLTTITTLITDRNAPPEFVETLRGLGVQVLLPAE
jgi:DeoR/GlpR family transcriptional regulator of sugar metabolism